MRPRRRLRHLGRVGRRVRAGAGRADLVRRATRRRLRPDPPRARARHRGAARCDRGRGCIVRADWSAVGEAAAPEIDDAEYADLDAIIAALPPEEDEVRPDAARPAHEAVSAGFRTSCHPRRVRTSSVRLSTRAGRTARMATNVIEIEGLRKEYRRRKGRTVAVDGLDLAVPEGGVFGFLGPNGSGKTTTIRCVLGLARPTKGSVRLFGRPVPEGLAESIRRVGAIVEAPALFPTMSGRDNLKLLGAIDRIGRRRVDEVLDQVGLADRAGEQVRKYSLGMRQRLALGAALLKDPALLILDEPANGLDPAGMRSVRELLQPVVRRGADGVRVEPPARRDPTDL